MKTWWQRLVCFFLVGLPLDWKEVKKYWYLVLLWVILLLLLNYYFYQNMMEVKQKLLEDNYAL